MLAAAAMARPVEDRPLGLGLYRADAATIDSLTSDALNDYVFGQPVRS